MGDTPSSVNHQNLFVAAKISFNLAPGVSLSQATAAIEHQIRQLGMPASIHGGFYGTAKVFQQSLANELVLMVAPLLAVYIVLGVLYESYVHRSRFFPLCPRPGSAQCWR
jgi:multidrug efflux pump